MVDFFGTVIEYGDAVVHADVDPDGRGRFELLTAIPTGGDEISFADDKGRRRRHGFGASNLIAMKSIAKSAGSQ